MFIDEVILTCRAGKGGDGVIAWRREKYIPKWWPYGGNGGKWGNVMLRATTNENTLIRYRHVKEIKAKDGEKWATQEMHGAHAPDTIVDVPVGTVVIDEETGGLVVDLTRPGEIFLLCEWGRWGFGNAHFTSSTRQTPNFAELGDIGEVRQVRMELKLVADVGLVGLPNAGKSTLIQSLTNVRPKIANYPFTTLVPNLGVMEWKGRTLVIEDVPWLIEWAHEGRGLGFQFLKHIERCRVIVHLIDASVGEEVVKQYEVIREEMKKWDVKNLAESLGSDDQQYHQKLSALRVTPSHVARNEYQQLLDKPEIIILSKSELIDPDHLLKIQQYFEKATRKKIDLSISAGAYIRLDELKDMLIQRIPETAWQNDIWDDELRNISLPLRSRADPRQVKVSRLSETVFCVEGERIEEIVRMTDMRFIDGVNRIYDVMEKMNVIKKIHALLAHDGGDISAHETKKGKGFFVGEEDKDELVVEIAGKRFSLENIVFMRDKNF